MVLTDEKKNHPMTIGSLFDGSGGFPLAAFLCGGTPVWASEVEPYPIAVTRSRFPQMKHLGDVYQCVSTESGRNKQYSSWIGVRTPMGEIKETVWYQLAEALIRRKGEQQLLGHLIQWESEHNYTNDSPDTVRKKAIQLHVDRIFDNPRWVDFVSFNCRFRPEALEDAHLVTVINECCQEPGVVTQEQIDASANGTVACPCCGRWSPFRVIEQAIQTESAAGQTEEAKGGMHLC